MNRYGYATLDAGMENILRRYVGGKRVVEIGAGGGTLALDLLRPASASLLLVEKEDYACRLIRAYETGKRQARVSQEPESLPPLEVRCEYAETGPREGEHFDVLVLSWPANRKMPGLLERWLPAADVIIYIGCNDSATHCGWPGLFQAFLERELLEYVKHPLNDLLILGPNRVSRTHTLAERRAFTKDRE